MRTHEEKEADFSDRQPMVDVAILSSHENTEFHVREEARQRDFPSLAHLFP